MAHNVHYSVVGAEDEEDELDAGIVSEIVDVSSSVHNLSSATPEQFDHRIKTRLVQFDTPRYIMDGWAIVSRNHKTFLAAMIMYLVAFLQWMAVAALGWSYVNSSKFNFLAVFDGSMTVPRSNNDDMVRVVMFRFFLGWAQSVAVLYPLMASFYVALFNAMRTDGSVYFWDFLVCYKPAYFPHLALLASVLYVVGSVLMAFFIAPGVYFSFGTLFAVPLHYEQRHLSIIQVMSTSFRVVHRYFCSMLGFVISLIMLQVLGVVGCGVGLVITIPTAGAATAFCYHHVIGATGCPLAPALQVSVQLTERRAQRSSSQ